MRVQIALDPIEFDIDDVQHPHSTRVDDEVLKEIVWNKFGKEILQAAKVTRLPNNDALEVENAPTDAIIPTQPHCAPDHLRRLELLDTIAQVQRVFLERESLSEAFGCLLTGLLSMVNSEYGFIGEAMYTPDGDMYLQIHSRSSSSFHLEASTRDFFERNEKEAVNLYNLHSLFGECLLTKKPVLSNDVHSDIRSGGVPPGHPDLNRFLGVPFFKQHGEILGVVGVANKPDKGYTEDDIKLLDPFVLTCSSVIQAYRQIKKNENLIDDLEQKVRERTEKLQRANQDLEEANRRVVQASAAQLEHFALCSHEIRTPLNCIIGLSSLLLESEMTPMQDEAVHMIVSSGDLLLTVVNDVLDYSKLETGNVEIEIQRSSLQEALNALVHSIAMKAESKNIRLRTLYDFMLPEFIQTDSRRVQQILYNLLGNATKHSPEGSVIDLRVELSAGEVLPKSFSPSPPPPSNQTDKKFIRFTVKDYGHGIASNDFAKIFEPFRQAARETELVNGGTGLGLAITTKLVNGLGGFIHVDSVEGSWSRFTVDLPFDEPPVDPVKLSENLRNAVVFLITNDIEVAAQVTHALRLSQVEHVHFRSSEEMDRRISSQGFLRRGRTYVSLVQEGLFRGEANELLGELVTSTVLLTFGPRFEVAQSQGHFRSLIQMIPSVLIRSIGTFVTSCRGQERSLNRQLSLRSLEEEGHYQNYRILVAEDNKINQKVLVRMLTRIGIEDVDVVENGQEAVDAEAAKQYDVVFMDMQMPVMDGLEACELITDRETGHRIASVVFVTAHVSPTYEAKCEKAGSSGFLPKPFNLSDIEQCLQNMYVMRDGERDMASDWRDDDNGIESDSSPVQADVGPVPAELMC